MYCLQSRWKLEKNGLYYYGLRCPPHMFDNALPLTRKQRKIVSSLPRELNEQELDCVSRLIGVQIVPEKDLRRVPKSLSEARFCISCCANDFMIPGLEFDPDGRCPLCCTAEETARLKSLVPIVDEIPRSERSRFDAALFYTGGKDSTYMLYCLSKVKGLRILALTWEIPFMSESAKKSIENAKKQFSNVEFISRTVDRASLQKIYRKLYERNGNTCACPSLAYLLFYPELVTNRVPCFIAGNEPVQALGLYYNHMAPAFAYRFSESRLLPALMNLGRLITLRPPLKQGQFQTLMTMKQLAYGDHPIKKLSGYNNELVSGIVAAIREVPEMLPPLRRSIRSSSRTGNVPAFVHLDMDKLCGGRYDWNKVKDILVNECGWVPPDDSKKALHTSCSIERCKDHTQFIRFYHCKSKMIPFSALEFSLASRSCGRTREEMLYEMEHLLGFSLQELPECAVMRGFLEE